MQILARRSNGQMLVHFGANTGAVVDLTIGKWSPVKDVDAAAVTPQWAEAEVLNLSERARLFRPVQIVIDDRRRRVVDLSTMSYDDKRVRVDTALRAAEGISNAYPQPPMAIGGSDYYLKDLNDEYAIYCKDGKHWRRGYTIMDAMVTFTTPPEEVTQDWKPV